MVRTVAILVCLLSGGNAVAQETSLLGFVEALKNKDARVRLAGLMGLGGAGAGAAPHAEAIGKLLKDSVVQVRRGAAAVLQGLGKDAEKAAPALASALRDTDPTVKHTALKALLEIGPGAVPHLEPALKSMDSEVRLLALTVVEAAGSDPAALKALAAALKDVSSKVRIVALSALGKAAREVDVRTAVEAIGPALQDKNTEVRTAAAAALLDLNKSAAAGPLLLALKDATPAIRQTAAQALGTIGDELDMAGILALRGALADEDARVRQYAAAGLAKAGVKARELGEGKKVVTALFKLMGDKDSMVRQTAAYALGHVGIDDKDDIKLLAEGIKDAQASVRAMTIESLAQYSHADVPLDWRHFVLGHLAEGIKDKDKRVALIAAKLLVDEKGVAVPGLIKLVESAVGQPRTLAAQCLGEIGPGAKEAIPALQKMSREGGAEARQAALVALQKIME